MNYLFVALFVALFVSLTYKYNSNVQNRNYDYDMEYDKRNWERLKVFAITFTICYFLLYFASSVDNKSADISSAPKFVQDISKDVQVHVPASFVPEHIVSSDMNSLLEEAMENILVGEPTF